MRRDEKYVLDCGRCRRQWRHFTVKTTCWRCLLDYP